MKNGASFPITKLRSSLTAENNAMKRILGTHYRFR
jgi:hypothetical protein